MHSTDTLMKGAGYFLAFGSLALLLQGAGFDAAETLVLTIISFVVFKAIQWLTSGED